MNQGIKLLKEASINSWETISANLPPISLFGLVIFLLSWLISIPAISVLAFIVYIGLFYFLVKIALRLSAGEKVDFKPIEFKLNEVIFYTLASIIYMLMITFGFVLFVLPGLYLATKYLFASYILVDKKLPIKESFEKGAKLTKGKQMMLIPAIVVFVAIPILISWLFDKLYSGFISNLLMTIYEIYTTFIGIYLYRKFEGLKS